MIQNLHLLALPCCCGLTVGHAVQSSRASMIQSIASSRSVRSRGPVSTKSNSESQNLAERENVDHEADDQSYYVIRKCAVCAIAAKYVQHVVRENVYIHKVFICINL